MIFLCTLDPNNNKLFLDKTIYETLVLSLAMLVITSHNIESSCFLRRPHKLMKSSQSIWRYVVNIKLTVKIMSFLWPSQKTWTLLLSGYLQRNSTWKFCCVEFRRKSSDKRVNKRTFLKIIYRISTNSFRIKVNLNSWRKFQFFA